MKHGPVQRLEFLIAVTKARGLSKLDAGVVGVLLEHFNRAQGETWPNQKTIAAALNVTPKAVQNTLERLQEQGWVTVSRRRGRLRGRDYGTSYTLNFDAKLGAEKANSTSHSDDDENANSTSHNQGAEKAKPTSHCEERESEVSRPRKRTSTPEKAKSHDSHIEEPDSEPDSEPVNSEEPSSLFGDLEVKKIDEVEEAVSIYNAIAESTGKLWVTATGIPPHRRKAITARLKECKGLEAWRYAMSKAAASDFLMGRSARKLSFRPSIDWFARPEKFAMLIDGAYDNNGRAGGALEAAIDKMFGEPPQ